jgi:hypothetical protein
MEVAAEGGNILEIRIKRNPKALFIRPRKFGIISDNYV